MAKFVSLKLTGESNYWLVDLEAGVVSVVDGIAANDGNVAETNSTSGLDVAFVTEMHDDAFSAKFDK
jgi:hypothetical protein